MLYVVDVLLMQVVLACVECAGVVGAAGVGCGGGITGAAARGAGIGAAAAVNGAANVGVGGWRVGVDVGGTGVLFVHVAGFSMVACRCRACVRRVRARRLPAVVEVEEELRAGVRRMRSRRLLEGE